MFDLIGSALAFFYDLTGSYGGSIMLLTLGIMILLTPLTLKGTRSMIAMQRLQPEMKRLQSKYKDDRQKLNEEMMKFYKENNINPVGGCLPLLLQMPVFFVLYRVLYGLTNPSAFASDFGRLAGASATSPGATVADYGTFQPDHLDPSSAMFMDLSQVREMGFVGLDLARSAFDVFQSSIVGFLPYLVLIVTIGVTTWYQQRQIQGRSPNMASANPQQQMIMKVMPFFLPLISLTLPAGVVLYFFVSNLYRIGQQSFITRTMYRDADGAPIEVTPASTDDEDKPKGLMAQLREMADPGNASDGGKGTAKNRANGGGKGAKTTSGAKGRGSSRQARKGKAAPRSGRGTSAGSARSSGNGKGSGGQKSSAGAGRGAAGGSGAKGGQKSGGQTSGGQKSGGQKGSPGKGSPGKGGKGSAARSGAKEAAATKTSGADRAAADGGAGSNGDDGDGAASTPASRGSQAPSRRPPSPQNRSKAKKKRR